MNSNKIIVTLGLLVLSATVMSAAPVTKAEGGQVIFVCEHGNVKSLMAASYFNKLAEQKGLAVRAISRGSAPDSTTVPTVIVDGLRQDGIDVSSFHPAKVSAAEVSGSQRVILISTDLPASAQSPGATLESWNDVPPATINYPASSRVLNQHIEKLLEQFAATARK